MHTLLSSPSSRSLSPTRSCTAHTLCHIHDRGVQADSHTRDAGVQIDVQVLSYLLEQNLKPVKEKLELVHLPLSSFATQVRARARSHAVMQRCLLVPVTCSAVHVTHTFEFVTMAVAHVRIRQCSPATKCPQGAGSPARKGYTCTSMLI